MWIPKGLGLDWWPSKYGLGALGASEILSEAPHSQNYFLNHTKMLFVFCLLILLQILQQMMQEQMLLHLSSMKPDIKESHKHGKQCHSPDQIFVWERSLNKSSDKN